jgi:hypothetical protein
MYLNEFDLGNEDYSEEPKRPIKFRSPPVHRVSTSISLPSVHRQSHRYSFQESSFVKLVDNARVSFIENTLVQHLIKFLPVEHTTDQVEGSLHARTFLLVHYRSSVYFVQSTADLQFSHEEKRENAIFKVYVKPTRTHAPASNSIAEAQLVLVSESVLLGNNSNIV